MFAAFAHRPHTRTRRYRTLLSNFTVLLMLQFAACSRDESGALRHDEVLLEPADAGLTDVREIGAPPACDVCELDIRPVVTLGSHEDASLFRSLPTIVRTSTNYFVATVLFAADHEVLVFSPTGEQIGSLGRRGNGPGEFNYVASLAVGAGDSIFVAHDGAAVSVFTVGGGFQRTFRISGGLPDNFLLDRSHHLIGSSSRRTPESIDLPIHEFSGSGAWLRSFGTQNVTAPYGSIVRRLALAQDGTLWAAELSNYRLEQFDASGGTTRVLSVQPDPEWNASSFATRRQFEMAVASQSRRPPTNPGRLTRFTPEPHFEVAGLRIDSYNRIWTLLHVPSTTWKDVEMRYNTSVPESPLQDDIVGRLFDSVVDVIDPSTGHLLARKRVSGYAHFLNDGGLAVSTHDADGLVRVRIFDLQLNVPPAFR